MEVRRIGPDGGFLREFTDVRKRVQHLETRPSGVIATREMFIVTDPETGVQTIMGKLPDGSTGFQPFVGDIMPPPVATAPTATAQPGTITVSWDGTFVAGAEQPADFEHLNVIGHKIVTGTTVLSLEVGSIRLANESVVITTDIISYGEQWQFSFESEDYNGNMSERSARTPVIDVISYVDDSLVGEALADLAADTQAAQDTATAAQGAAQAAQDDADAAAAAALAANNLAGTKGKVLIQSTAPAVADQLAQNLWIDTTGGTNTPKRWNGTTWEVVTDKVAVDAASAAATAQARADQAFNSATSAATAAGNAQTSADSKNKIWYQTTAPAGTGHKAGDTWFDTDDGNRVYLWTGAAWTDHRDTGIAAAQTAANTALTSANGKNKVYYQTTMPSGGTYILGDTWFDTDDGNKIYVHNGTTFVNAQDASIAAAQSTATTASGTANTALSTANNKTKTYFQTSQPSLTGNTVGDLWFDTDDSNRVYAWNGASWASARDAGIASAASAASTAQQDATAALTAAQAAQAVADGAIRTFYQSAAPTGLNDTTNVGDLWFDTDDGQAYRWNGTAWVIIEDNSIAAALAAAQNAQTTADGKITTYYQPGQPATGEVGDLWFDTDDKNKPYYCSSIAPLTWAVVRDGTIADAQSTANTALTSANGKNRVYYQTAMPTGGTYILGDTWFDTDDGNKIYIHNGTTFVAAPLGTNAIANLAITNAQIADATIQSAKIGSVDAGTITVGTLSAARIGADTITASHIASDAITSNELAANSITAAKGQISDAAITTAKIGDAQITNAKIADATIQSAKIGSVDAGTISVGTLSAARIAAGSLSADKVLISNTSNSLVDPSFLNSTLTDFRESVSSGGLAGWTLNTATATTMRFMSRTTATANDIFSFAVSSVATGTAANHIQVTEGQKWLLEVGVETDISAGVRWNIYSFKSDGTVTYTGLSPYSIAVGKRTLSYVYTVPAGVVAVSLVLACNTTAVAWKVYGNAFVGIQSGATMIQNGAITTDHMTAGTIDASVLTAGSITAPKIAAKTITTDKLVITSSDNLVVGGDMALSAASWQKSAFVTANATAGRGGGGTLRFTGSIAAQSSLNLSNRVTVEPDNKFRCSIFVKSNAALAIDRVRLMVRCFTTATASTDVIGTYNTAALVANTWTQIQGVSAPLPADTIAVEFYLYVTNNATGTITDVDYVSVTRASDATLVVDGAITATKLESDLILATKIVAGDPAGTHAEMSPQGFRVYADAIEVGAPSTEVVRLGVANTNDYFAITKSTGELAATISQDGVGSFSQVNATDGLYYKGKEINEILDALPKGSLYKAELSADLDNITTRYGLVEAQFVIKGDRQIELAGGIKFYPVDPATECYLDIRYTVDGTAPTITSQLLVNIPLGTVSNTTFDYKEFRHTIRPASLPVGGAISDLWEGKTMRLLMVVYKGNGVKLMPRAGLSTYLYVTDVGKGIPHVPNFTPGGGSNPTPQPPAPAQQTYVKQYQTTNSMNYQGSNAQYNFDTGHMYQGLSPAGYGNLKSIALFPDMTADLSGASINYIRVYFNFVHWYYNSGGTAYIGVHPHTAIPGSFTWTGNGQTGGRVASSAGWPKPGARWVDLPADQWNNFKSGIWKGITLDGDGTYGTYGYADRPTIEISYTK